MLSRRFIQTHRLTHLPGARSQSSTSHVSSGPSSSLPSPIAASGSLSQNAHQAIQPAVQTRHGPSTKPRAPQSSHFRPNDLQLSLLVLASLISTPFIIYYYYEYRNAHMHAKKLQLLKEAQERYRVFTGLSVAEAIAKKAEPATLQPASPGMASKSEENLGPAKQSWISASWWSILKPGDSVKD